METTTKQNYLEITDFRDEIIEALGITEDSYLTGSGNHSTGFWHNEIKVDLEKLQGGDVNAFCVIEDIHDTAGISFRQWHNIDKCYTLPDGVKTDAIIDWCVAVFDRADELTAGLSVEFDGSDEKAFWYDEDGNRADAPAFWAECGIARNEIQDLDCFDVYDLSLSDNRPYVMEALVFEFENIDCHDRAAVAVIVNDKYEDNTETVFVGHSAFIDYVVENAE